MALGNFIFCLPGETVNNVPCATVGNCFLDFPEFSALRKENSKVEFFLLKENSSLQLGMVGMSEAGLQKETITMKFRYKGRGRGSWARMQRL